MRARQTGVEVEGGVLADLAEAHLGRGEVAVARRTAEDAVAMARRRGIPVQEIRGQLGLARALRHAEGLEAQGAIEAALGRSRALVEETGARLYAPRIHLEPAELARLLGDEAGRRRELAEALRLFAAMGAEERVARIARELE